MRQRRFGNTDLIVSEVGFGCARLGGVFDGTGRSDVTRTLRAALAAGITFYDTADMYTQGESERSLGEAFAKDRDKIVLASKAGYRLPAQKKAIGRIKPLLRPVVRRMGIKRESIPAGLKGTITQDFSSTYLRACLEGSLKRLRTDYLDLFQLHSPPTSLLEDGEFLVTLEALKQEGKIRYYGVSCETTRDAEICLRYPQISALQIRLSLLEQSGIATVLPRAATQGVAIIARECFAGGMLAKRSHDPSPEVDGYQRLSSEMGRTVPEVAVQFILGLPGISVALLGMRTQAHLMDSLRYLAQPLSTTNIVCLATGTDLSLLETGGRTATHPSG